MDPRMLALFGVFALIVVGYWRYVLADVKRMREERLKEDAPKWEEIQAMHEDPTTDLVSTQLGVTHAEFMCFLQKTIDSVESGALPVKICDAYWSERAAQRDGVLHVEIGTVSPMKFRVGVNANVEYRETWVDVRCSSFDACIQFYNKTAAADKERTLYAALCTLLVQKCIALRDPATWGVMYETHHQLRATPMFRASGCCTDKEKAP